MREIRPYDQEKLASSEDRASIGGGGTRASGTLSSTQQRRSDFDVFTITWAKKPDTQTRLLRCVPGDMQLYENRIQRRAGAEEEEHHEADGKPSKDEVA